MLLHIEFLYHLRIVVVLNLRLSFFNLYLIYLFLYLFYNDKEVRKMKKKLIIIVSAIIIIGGGILLYFVLNNKNNENDNVRFAKEYTDSQVGEDNVFVYKNIDEIINILKYGTGVVYLGFPECPWCQAYVKYLNETAKDANIEKIYYFNILEDRKNNTEKYQEIVSILGDNLQRDDEGNLKVFVPNVSFVVNGKIIGNDYETSLDTKGFEKPSDYWTEEEVSELENTLSGYMKEVYKALYSCTDCNK